MEKSLKHMKPSKRVARSRLPGVRAVGGTFTGNIWFLKDFRSAILKNRRHIWVYLPPGYDRHRELRYPVLYMQDGQNVFNSETAFAGVDWGADEAAELLIRKKYIQELIIVAVSNTPARESEYTHVPDEDRVGGRLDRYARFLIEELKPFIDRHYRTKPYHTGIMGSSLGGLSAFYLGWTYPEIFSVVGALSPSFWWADKEIIRRVRKDRRRKGPAKIYLDMGSREDSDADDEPVDISEAVLETREMFLSLLQKGYIYGHDLYYIESVGGGHNESFWGRRVYLALMALYGRSGRKEIKRVTGRPRHEDGHAPMSGLIEGGKGQ
jgi:predicted alpha/beta superfamily hydrolase